MTQNASFTAERRFWDDQHFPYGFSRSGHFTIEQAALLEKHGYAYTLLAKGEREPVDDLEKAFVTFCLGEKEAESVHEKIWKRYSEAINRRVDRYSLTRAEARYGGAFEEDSMDLDD
ncbi:MAG: DUF413 domain-containing protein [Pseudomonadales bacterium]|jgi:hypothetical protein